MRVDVVGPRIQSGAASPRSLTRTKGRMPVLRCQRKPWQRYVGMASCWWQCTLSVAVIRDLTLDFETVYPGKRGVEEDEEISERWPWYFTTADLNRVSMDPNTMCRSLEAPAQAKTLAVAQEGGSRELGLAGWQAQANDGPGPLTALRPQLTCLSWSPLVRLHSRRWWWCENGRVAAVVGDSDVGQSGRYSPPAR